MDRPILETSYNEHSEQGRSSLAHRIDPSNHPKNQSMIHERNDQQERTLNARSSICSLVNFNDVSKLIYCALRLAVL